MKKRMLLGLAIIGAFFVGYGSTAVFAAYPSGGVHGRAEFRGYFTNVYDNWGHAVFPEDYDGMAVPSSVDTADEFINFIKYTKLDLDGNGSGNQQEKTGAAFIINTMIGSSPASRNRPPNSDQIAEWENRVRYAEDVGRISWKYNFSYTLNSYYQGAKGGGSPNDNAFFDENGTSQTIIFRNSSGAVIYAIRRQCANPVGNGNIGQIPNDLDFAMSGRTSIDGNKTTVVPNEVVTFRHYVKNNGPTATAPISINWSSQVPTSGYVTNSGSGGTFTAGQEKWLNAEPVTTPNNATAGQTICRRVGFTPANEGGGSGVGNSACVTVVIPAKLKAAMSVSPAAMAPGDTATFQPVISATQNASPVVVNCTITRTVYPAAGGTQNLGAQPCQTTGGDNNITIGAGASVSLHQNIYDAPDDIPVGSRVCDVITITNPNGAGYYNNFPADTTAEACVRIAKSPYVHFTGGDVWAGGGFAAVAPGTCTNNANIRTVTRGQALSSDGSRPGSGTTYAAFALGRITNFGSGSMGQVTATGLGDNWTFANTNPANLGFFNSGQHCINDYVNTYQGAPIIAGSNVNVGGTGNGAWRINGDANFVGANMGAGSQRVYFVNGNVTINNSLTYPANFSGGGQVPSLVIIATGDIRVDAAATQLDGIFISRGTFYTCFPKVEPATTSVCGNRLTINGSVMANNVDLFRTAGADGATPAAQKAPAEVFNLSPEVYLRNALNQTTNATIKTSQVRELPPRF